MLPHIDDFLMNLQANHYSPYTVSNYERYLEAFDRFLNENNIIFEGINKQTIISYKAHLASRGRNITELSNHSASQLTQRTINYKLAALRVYLRYLIDIDYPCPLVPETVTNLKAVPKRPQVPQLKDLLRLIEAPAAESNIIGLRDKAILETLFNTGLRVSELVGLNRAQVNLERKQIGLKGKGNKIRIVFLSNTVSEYIRRYLQSRRDHFEPLFIRYSGKIDARKSGEKMRLTARSIQKIVEKYAQRAGLPIEVTPHTLRHGFATYLAEEGANPAALQILLGHESLDTTTRYVHASDKYAEETHRKYHPLAKSV
ncbi:MAG TPA: tyrosine-type recombinase/integrase [Dehalococcoidia bacterium]|nr:tyrosine-type recombinase/integrase [Dehalococcoidia bacterium]